MHRWLGSDWILSQHNNAVTYIFIWKFTNHLYLPLSIRQIKQFANAEHKRQTYMSISALETAVRCVPAPFQQEYAAGHLDTAPPPGLQHWWQQTAENKRQRCSHAEHDSNFGEINSRFYHRVRSKLKVQNSSTFQRPKLHFSSTKIIDKKPYPSRGHSKFRLQCDTEVYCTVLTNTVMIKASNRLPSSICL